MSTSGDPIPAGPSLDRKEDSEDSLPWRYLGERVDARSTTTMVQFLRHGELIKTHPVKERRTTAPPLRRRTSPP